MLSILNFHFRIRAARSGQSFLVLILLIGGMVAVIGVLLAFFAGSLVDSGYGYQASVTAQAAATSGAEDALLRLDRDPSFAASGYALAVGSTTATVSVTQNAPSANLITISSSAIVSGRTGKINVILTENASTSQVTILSWQTIL